MPSLSIIIPTVGRNSLAATLASIARQEIQADDDVLLIGAGPQPDAAETFAASGLPGRYRQMPRGNDWGASERNWAMPYAYGDFLAFMDDDDVYTPGAFSAMRTADPAALNVYRMHGRRRVLWREPRLRIGNVSTQMLVVANRPAILGQWGHRREGDYDFAASTASKIGRVTFHETIIARIRP